jgi:hypothetical protein
MRSRVLLGLVVLLFALPAAVLGAVGVGTGGGTPGTSSHFRLIGHDPLFSRGMNAAPALFADGEMLYVGNRTDGQARHPHPGILVVDVSDPASPTVVNEIGPPHAGNVDETTRELRVWPEKELLIVLSFRCSPVIHDCAGGPVTPTYRFFDLSNPADPEHILTHVPTQADGTVRVPHEFFLWVDPEDEDRALLWESDPTTSVNPNRANMIIRDISRVPDGVQPTIVAQGNWNQFYPGAANPAAYDNDLAVHSMAPTADGRLTHLAYLRGHYLALDTSEVVDTPTPSGVIDLNDNLITQVPDRPQWGAGNNCSGHTAAGCAESHTSMQVPGRPYELNVDEVYGTFTHPSFGWPWGWVRLIDIRDPAHPKIVGEYKIHQNTPAYTPAPGENEFNSYSSHNPTVLPRLAFDAWHSGGLQAIDIAKPHRPRQTGWFSPTPLPAVATEDPALSRGPNKVVMWSYPIISDGLIYVVDIRNGLYVVEYKGKHQNDVRRIDFLEGNSNLGDMNELSGLDH